MRFGLPWRVEGIRYEARETAEAAARRAGLPLNEWLNAVILQQAGRQESRPQPHSAAHSDDRADDFSRVQLRLDDLTRRIEHVARTGPAAYAPKRNLYDTEQIADQVERLEQRVREVASHRPELAPQGAQLPPTLDRAADALTSHRGALSGEEMPLRTPGTPFRLDGLEEQLRHITEQIETLKRPALEEAIQALRAELGDIGRALNAARKLQFGTVWINDHFMLVSEMPHGGFKESGYGKDQSMYAIEDYTVVKHVMFDITGAAAKDWHRTVFTLPGADQPDA